MNWISYAQLHADVSSFSATLPPDLVAVVGVPRSGVMAASLLALHRHVHLSDAETFARTGGFCTPGLRLTARPPTAGKVLLLDDSAITCRSINAARKQIRRSERCGGFELICGAVYVTPAAVQQLDVSCRIVPMPRVFEWNWLASQQLETWMSDVDGVLCYDPAAFDDDSPRYEAALRDAVPRYLPRRPVRSLVTCRLARWRRVTEDWLARYGVVARELILHPAPTAEARRKEGRYGQWKGEHYRKSPCTLFVESSAMQAAVVAQVARKPVLCLENNRMYP